MASTCSLIPRPGLIRPFDGSHRYDEWDGKSITWTTHPLQIWQRKLLVDGGPRTGFTQMTFCLQRISYVVLRKLVLLTCTWIASLASVSIWGVMSHWFNVTFRPTLCRLYCLQDAKPRRRRPQKACFGMCHPYEWRSLLLFDRFINSHLHYITPSELCSLQKRFYWTYAFLLIKEITTSEICT